jgi:hypothetical protein
MISPRLNLDFTSASLDGRVSVARALNTATRTNSSGLVEGVSANTPRFDFDPITKACRGLLIEESRINLCQRSEDFTDALWVKTAVTIGANATTAPDGSLTADKIIENTANTAHNVFQAVTTVGATVYSPSIYVKSSGRNVQVIAFQPVSPFANLGLVSVDLSNGSILSGSGVVTSVGNGWYRISVTGAAPDALTRLRVGLLSGSSASYTGDGTSGVFVWGASFEAGSSATSYIPNLTTGSTTRNADVATVTGTNFSDWWQPGKGSALVRARPSVVSGTRPLIQFDDTTGGNIIALRGNATNPELYVRTGGLDQVQIDAGTIAANTSYRLAGSWAENSCAASINSGTPVLDGVATIPVVTQSRLGSDGTNYLNGHLEAVEYYDERVLDASLQVVSSTAGYRSIIGPVFRDAIIS